MFSNTAIIFSFGIIALPYQLVFDLLASEYLGLRPSIYGTQDQWPMQHHQKQREFVVSPI